LMSEVSSGFDSTTGALEVKSLVWLTCFDFSWRSNKAWLDTVNIFLASASSFSRSAIFCSATLIFFSKVILLVKNGKNFYS
jgi:hypothetical protein